MERAQALRAVEAPQARIATTHQRKRILLVDDHMAMLEILVEFIGNLGFKVTLADNGLEGFMQFSENTFDLVITDLNMPGLDGWQLTSRIKAVDPHIPVLMITGEDRVRVRKAMGGGNVNAVLFKPFRLGELIENIRDLTGNR